MSAERVRCARYAHIHHIQILRLRVFFSTLSSSSIVWPCLPNTSGFSYANIRKIVRFSSLHKITTKSVFSWPTRFYATMYYNKKKIDPIKPGKRTSEQTICARTLLLFSRRIFYWPYKTSAQKCIHSKEITCRMEVQCLFAVHSHCARQHLLHAMKGERASETGGNSKTISTLRFTNHNCLLYELEHAEAIFLRFNTFIYG